MIIEPIKIIEKYFTPDSKSYYYLVKHSQAVTKKALLIAQKLNLTKTQKKFIAEASMLQDIGICQVKAENIGCFGKHDYICHGYLGRKLLEKEGLPKHALVAERHVAMGLTIEDMKKRNFPIPIRDMTPQTIEEEIIAYADRFFSKQDQFLDTEKPISMIKESLKTFSQDKLLKFNILHRKFKT